MTMLRQAGFRVTLVLCIALVAGLGVDLARAGPPSCTATMDVLAFVPVDPQSSLTDATSKIDYTCTNGDTTVHYIDLCFGIGSATNPRVLKQGANSLNYQIYQDAARTIWWGATFDNNPNQSGTAFGLIVQVPASTTVTGTVPVYGRVLGGQTGMPYGAYSDAPSGNTVQVKDNGNNPSPSLVCGGTNQTGTFSVSVNAQVQNACSVNASALDLGTVNAGAVNTTSSSSITVNCASGIAYTIGLAPSNGNTAGAGQLSGTGANTDKVAYQLYQDAVLTTIWGNTATVGSAGNGKAGTGSGSNQSYTVWARAPTSNVKGDTYTDTVIVTVNY